MSTLGCGGSSSGDDAGRAAIVEGTLTFPAIAADKPYGVELQTSPGTAAVVRISGRTRDAITLPYAIKDVPGGTYYLLAYVDVDVDESAGTGSTPGDFAGWYGGVMANANPPAAANVAVPKDGSVMVDLALVQR